MSNKTEEALRREVRDAFFNPTLGLHRSVDILDHPNVRKAFDALRDHYQARPTFEGDEEEVRERLQRRGNRYDDGGLMAGELVNPDGPAALALLDAKDAEIATLREKLRLSKENATDWAATAGKYDHEWTKALSRAEQADERRLRELAGADAEREAIERKLNQAEAALAEERKAMSEAASYAIEDLREWLVNYPDAYDRDTTEQAITTLSRFILPAKPAVDPLVEALRGAIGGLFTPGWLEERASNLRAAIERAGGVKAVFGEGA